MTYRERMKAIREGCRILDNLVHPECLDKYVVLYGLTQSITSTATAHEALQPAYQ